IMQADLKRMAEEVGGRYHCYSTKREVGNIVTYISGVNRMSADWVGEGQTPTYPGTAIRTTSGQVKVKQPVVSPALLEDQDPLNGFFFFFSSFQKAMTQFEWYDGTVKNVHIDPPILYDYQRQLGRMVTLYERRIDWLSTASRRIWGPVCEKRVAILIDASKTNSTYIIHIQHCLHLLLEQQMASKDLFNIIAFGSDIKAWQSEMVPPTVDNLQSAWRWVLTLRCEGTRNMMSVLRRALEVDLKDKDNHESQSIYLLTTGIPDQEMDVICSYMSEVCAGCDLHLNICLFSTDNSPLDEDIPPRYASRNETALAFKEIARASGGRFHWFGETGIYESDDIRIILSEIENAINYSHKVALQKLLYFKISAMFLMSEEGLMLEKQKKNKPLKLLSPKPTALTLARMV
uniref:VWFA domain-containing protein n=1 Tax=Salvator merianae TaxID=96440 RepID=A0A8D0KMJ0_SALMN